MAEVTAKSLGRNSIYAGVAEAWRILSRLVLTPIIIARLGMAGYGTWTLLFSVCGYVDMLNMSFGFAYNKFAAEYDRRKDYATLSSLLSAGIALGGAIALLALLGIWLARRPILSALGVPDALLDDAAFALVLVTFCLLLRMSFGCVFYVLSGLQRLDLQHKLDIFASVLEFGVALALLAAGKGLMALAYAHFTGQVISTIVAWGCCRRLCPELRMSPWLITKKGCRMVLSLGFRFQVLSGLATLFVQGIKLVISAICGVSVLGIYELADKLLSLSRAVSGAIIDPLMPAFAHLHAAQDTQRWRALFVHSSKLIALFGMSALVGLFVYADRLIVVWTGNAYPQAAWTIRVMAFGHFVWVMTGAGTSVLRGQGTLRLEMSNAILRMILAAVLIPPAYLWAGYEGLVVAVLVARVASSVWFLVQFARRERFGFGWYAREILGRSCVIGLAAAAAGSLLRALPTAWIPMWDDRWRAAAEVGTLGLLFGLSTGAALWFGLFSADDRAYVLRRVLPSKGPGVAARV